MKIETFQLDELVPAKVNPNKMTDEQDELLTAAIGEWDYLQPIIVNVRGGAREIVDGEHRINGLRHHGYTEAQCVVVDLAPDRVKALRLAMNRLRGEVDLKLASDIVKELQLDGWGTTELTYTGFSQEEIDGLLAIGAPEDPGIGASLGNDSDGQAPDKAFVLEIPFSTKEDYQLARRKLKKAAGKGNDLGIGLLNVLGELGNAPAARNARSGGD